MDDETRYICGRSDGTLTCVHCDGSCAHRHEHGHCLVVRWSASAGIATVSRWALGNWLSIWRRWS